MRTRKLLSARFLGGLLMGCAQLFCGDAPAAPVTWIGGSGIWTDGDANNANWNPADEPDIDDEAIFNTADSVALGNANTIQALTMSGGIDLDVNGHGLTVDGLVQLVDAGTFLFIEGPGSAVIADSVTINNGGQIRLNGLLNISEETATGLLDINAGGTISGSGTVHFGGVIPSGTTLLTNDGSISALSPAPFLGAAPPARTFAINSSNSLNALIDLDGGSGNGILNVFRNQTLDVNVRLTDQFSGDINLFQNSVLEMATSWILDSGTIDVDNGLVDNPPPTPDIPAGVSHIRGGELTQTGGTITVVDADGILEFDAAFHMEGGNLVNNGLVVFRVNADVGTAANFTMPASSSSITVLPGITVSIDQANFDADGTGSATNVITIGNGGNLDLDLGAGADESLGGFIQLNGGELDVTTADTDWTIQGNVNVSPNSGTSQINGHKVTMSTASIVVGENSMLQINAANLWGASGSLDVKAGGVASLTGTTTFGGGGSFTGAGTLLFAGITTFEAPTMIDMPGGTVDLDGNDVIGSMVTIDADTTINVDTMADFGNDNVIGFNTLVLNDVATLHVNLSGSFEEWTLTADARLDINASTSVSEGSGIHGSDFNMAGMATVSGNSSWGARTDISGAVTIAANGRLMLGGGNRFAGVNRLEGGTINGEGILGAESFTGLNGFGVIDADVDFDGDSELFAAGGTLTLGGTILDARFIGTLDANAILEITNPWNTAVIQQVALNGGELRGATITNDNLILGASGDTLVTARVINNLLIFADNGNLELETAGNDNDWDGTTNDGQLYASHGDITLHDNADFEYAGTIFIESGSELFTTGFSFETQPGSLVDMTGGTFRMSANRTTEIGGEMVVNAEPESAFKTGGATSTFQFEPTADVTLNGNLRLDSGITRIEAGAAFTGAGRLINHTGRRLLPNDQANIGVLVENQGVYANSDSNAGRNNMLAFVQTATGTFRIDLQGTAVSQFDRLQIDNQAQLAGSLELVLGDGYVPVLGDMHNIISATGGVSGTFSNVIRPIGMPAGLMFDVIYNPMLVQLMVIEELLVPGDYNQDGVVDAADYVVWRDTLGQQAAGLAADGNNNGSIDAGDYDVWRAHFGNTAAPGSGALTGLTGRAAVPEPSTFLLLVTAAMLRWRLSRNDAFIEKASKLHIL